MLQNHPGETPFPVAPLRVGDLPEQRGALVTAPGVLGALLALVGVFTIGLALEAPDPAYSVPLAGGLMIAVGFAMIALSVVLVRRATRAPEREQARYYEEAGLRPLTMEQRQALKLDGVNTGYGSWSETLEDWPCEARVGVPDPPFRTFGLLSIRESREQLDHFWGITTRAGYADVLRRLHEGMHSRLFASAALGDDAHAMFDRLGALLGCPTARVQAAAQPRAGGPPTLGWGFDLWRALRLARDAYMSGLISEEEAWTDMLKTSAWIHTIFDSLDDYHESLRLGHAFWANDLQKVNERAEVLSKYVDGEFPRPVSRLPWVKGDAQLPSFVMDGFAAYRADESESDEPGGGPLLH